MTNTSPTPAQYLANGLEITHLHHYHMTLQSIPATAQLLQQSGQALAQGSRSKVSGTLNHLCQALFQLKQELGDTQWQALRKELVEHPITALLSEAPQIKHSQEWPRGYRGDAYMMDLIYGTGRTGEQLAHTSRLGKSIHETQADWATHRAAIRRLRTIAHAVDEQAQKVGKPIAILSVACGHLRELSFCHTWQTQQFERWVAMDQDPRSLALIREKPTNDRLELWEKSIVSLLRQPQTQQFDFIYAAGLYDYLQDRTAKLLTSRLFELLRAGGKLLVANFTPNTLEMGFLEAFMDWPLIYRNMANMTDLAGGLPEGMAQFKVYHDLPNENNRLVYLEVTRKNP
ncbi:MAG: class I SAM-dependent methyltransferase [Saprospiraceae bacterium]|nr:class I SAM-dependent methyltransferase [Saprospiraceae bacterium]